MHVVVAKTAGFCMGVRKAMDSVLDAANKGGNNGRVYTEGPLIHNPQVLDMLEKKGINTLKNESNIAESTVVIRAHGITPERRRELEKSGANICDATCPRVMRVQKIIDKHSNEGYSTIIIGDEGHAEVIGLLGYAGGNGYVISSPDDVPGLPDLDKVCIVSQTTQDLDIFDVTVDKLKQRYNDLEVFNTICSSTSKRQEEVIDLCRTVDALIIVGGKNSANTNRLAKISTNKGTPTFLIETVEELDLEKFANFNSIGVTAGASTPNWLIQKVVGKVQAFHAKKGGKLRFFFDKAFFVVIGSFMYIGIGAASFSYASSILLGTDPKFNFCLIATLFLFSMYILNYFANKEAVALNEPSRAELYEKHNIIFVALGITAAVTSFILAFMVSIEVFFCVFFALLFGIAYRMSFIPKGFARIFKYRNLEQIPGSKEIFISMAWAVSAGLVPFLGSTANLTSTLPVTFAFIFSMVFMRTVLLDVRDVQGDSLVGRETIPIAIGKSNTKILLIVIAIVIATLLTISPMLGWTNTFSYYLLPCVAYACGYLYLYHMRLLPNGLACEAITDFNFILASIMVIMWWIFGY